MNKHLLKHIEILETVPEIQDLILELKIGTYIQVPGCEKLCKFIEWKDEILIYKNYDGEIIKRINTINFKIIGQVHEGHLRMFLGKQINGIDISISSEGYIYRTSKKIKDFNIIQLDNTKPYMEQSEEFFKKLNDWLIKEFSINL